jgi:Transposase
VNATTVAIDLAKNVFELAVADDAGNVIERERLSRSQLERYFQNRSHTRVVMEACATSHYWGRRFAERGMQVALLPPHYVRAYVRRNKTDRADATALLESITCPGHPSGTREIGRAAGAAGHASSSISLEGNYDRSDQHTARPVPGVRNRRSCGHASRTGAPHGPAR